MNMLLVGLDLAQPLMKKFKHSKEAIDIQTGVKMEVIALEGNVQIRCLVADRRMAHPAVFGFVDTGWILSWCACRCWGILVVRDVRRIFFALHFTVILLAMSTAVKDSTQEIRFPGTICGSSASSSS